MLIAASGGDGGHLVELPIGATEDRVVGSLDLQKVLRDGEHAFSPGLLARAHGGVLYVDEVNLLHDHLVDVLLDAAAMGRVHIERDGVSHSHDARFVLIGTMNPEEGELRPQLLDRFGLTVDVAASRDVDVRAEVIRARLAYEADPAGFAERYADADAELAARIAAGPRSPARCGVARQGVTAHRGVVCGLRRRRDARRPGGRAHRGGACRVAWREGRSDGNRSTRRTSGWPPNSRCRTVAAATRSTTRVWIRTDWTTRWNRQASRPTSSPNPSPSRTRRAAASPRRTKPPEDQGAQQNSGSPAGSTRASAPPSAAFRTKALVVPGVGEGAPGRRSRARNRTGTVVSAATEPDAGHGVHLFATLLAAAGRQAGPGRLRPGPEDVRRAVREGREGNLVIFVVDASGSMAARDRMSAVSGATLSLLRDAYQRRDKVAVITFRQQDARVLLPPTSSVYIASRRLARFDTGGKTPLAQGLLAARDLVVRERARDRARRSLVVVLTDGRATGGPDPLGRARTAAARLVAEGAAAIVVDCETSYVRLDLADDLAAHLKAPSVRLAQLRADNLTALVKVQADRGAA